MVLREVLEQAPPGWSASTKTLGTEFEQRVAHWLADGRITARETVVDGLENAAGALLSLLDGGNVGKMLVRLG